MAIPRLVVSYGQVRALRVVLVAVVICVTLVTTLRLHNRAPEPSIYDYTEGRTAPWRDWRHGDNETHANSPEGRFLKQLIQKHDLTNEVTWSARVVQAKFGAGRMKSKRPSMTEVATRLLERDFVNTRVADADLRLGLEDGEKLKLPVAGAKGAAVDASTLLFGVSTTYERLAYADHELIRDWQSWLTDGNGKSNGASLLLTLHKTTTKDELEEVEETLRSFGIDATVQLSKGGDDSTSRYIDLLQELKSHSATLKGKTFIGLVDDDVFFPSIGKLIQKLSKFHPDKQYYIGAPSERSDWAVDTNKTITYGGGAVFLTLPMVEQLVKSPCITSDTASPLTTDLKTRVSSPRTQEFHTGVQWDIQLYECITKHTSTDLHVLPSFFNPEKGELYSAADGTGPIDEGYASGTQPLTLHQYRNVHRFEAGKGHLVTRICGEDCFLQRFLFKDDWVLVNGYTLSHYPDGVDTVSLKHKKTSAQAEGDDGQKVVLGKRLVVDSDQSDEDPKAIAWAGRKRTWRLLDARVDESGEIWQAYVKRKDGGNQFEDSRIPGDRIHAEEERTDKDSIVVLIWKP